MNTIKDSCVMGQAVVAQNSGGINNQVALNVVGVK
jgi:hypothetical protein